jgi:MYXO-CTERM domain-containing protein
LAVPVGSAQTGVAGTGGSTSSTNTGGITWLLTNVGSEKWVDTSYKTPINKRQCDANEDLHISLTGIPMGFKYLEVWVGDNCQAGDRATRVGTALCTYVKIKEQDPSLIADSDFTIPLEEICKLGDGARSYYILPVTTMMGTEPVTTFAKVTLNIDKTPPAAPTGVSAGAGQTMIPVGWSQPSDSFYFWLVIDRNVNGGYTDSGAGASADCTSSSLTAGEEFDPESPSLPDGVVPIHLKEKVSKTTLTSEQIGITEGQVAVAVIAEDLGFNRSVLSNVACAQVVPTTGFWDAYHAAGGEAEPGCACATPGAGLPNAHIAWPVLTALGLLAGARRRMRRRA